MSPNNDPLAEFYQDESASVKPQESADPLAEFYEEKKGPFRDVISEELRSKGYEPDFGEELERAGELGRAEATRGLIKGATLGFSEHVPGLETGDNLAATGGEIIGAAAPITALAKVFTNPLVNLAAKSPVLQSQLGALAHLTGAFATGGTYGAITSANEKKQMPSVDDFIDHGATWALLDGALQAGGKAYQFTKSLLSKAKKTSKPAWKVVNETINTMREEGVDFTNPERVQAKALSILEEGGVSKEVSALSAQEQEISAQTKKLKDRKVEQKVFDKLESETPTEPYFPEEFEATEIMEDSFKNKIESGLEEVSPRAVTEKQLGENIKAEIDKGLKAAENAYKPAYELAEEAASTKFTFPNNTSRLAVDTLENLEALKTKPEGYTQVIKTLQNALEDAGFVINRNDEGLIEQVISEKNIRADKLMELGRRINKIVKYDAIDKSVKDRLKPVVQAIKQDIRAALGEDKAALELYNEAESEFTKSANKFGNQAIRQIRKTEAGEKVAKLVKNPTTLSNLKEVVSSKQYAEIERELLEHLKTLREDKAQAAYRELRPYLGREAQNVGKEIIESKLPKSSPNRKQILRGKIKDNLFNDLSKASITGERPETALKLWKTREGQQLIKDAIKDNPNKKEILKYLTDQSLKDFSASVVSEDGAINFKKLNSFLRDPSTEENLRLIGGEEGVRFFKNLESLSDGANKNLRIIEGKIDKGSAKARAEIDKAMDKYGQQRFSKMKQTQLDKEKDTLQYKMDDFFKSYGIKTKAVMTLLGMGKFGILGGTEAALGYELFIKLLKNKSVQKAIKQAAGPYKDPNALFQAYEAINKAVNEKK